MTKLEFPSELRALHSLLQELGRYTKTSGFHYSIERHNAYFLITHHLGKWRLRVGRHTGVIAVEDGEGLICKLFPPYDYFYFYPSRNPMPCKILCPREIQLPAGLTLTTKDVIDGIKEAITNWTRVRAGLPVESTE